MRVIRRLRRIDPADERGVSILIVALSLVVVFGMTVLVVDLGALIVRHRSLVNANDAGAHAAAASFAINESQPVTKEGPAQEHAERLAKKNVVDAETDPDGWWTVTPRLKGSGCDPTTCGTVTVRFQAGQSLFFAAVLGLGDQVTAQGAATAMWGPAGGGRPSPITVHIDWLESEEKGGRCKSRVPSGTTDIECAFWLVGRGGDNGDDEHGDSKDSEWAWTNLDEWDTSQGAGCPSVDSTRLSNWIGGIGVPQVRLNRAPTPTLVCTSSGHAADYLDDLEDQIDRFKVFPVARTPGPVGNKYDIAGFTVLRIDDVIPGHLDGKSETFDCSWDPVDLEQGSPVYLADADPPCQWENLHYPGDPDKDFPLVRKGQTEYTGDVTGQCAGLDYCYEPATSEIRWQQPEPLDNASIEWQYVIDTPGECRHLELDPDAVCLVASWQGYRTGGINPGGGVDFGLRGIRLSA